MLFDIESLASVVVMANNANAKNTRKRDEITCIQLPKDLRNQLAKLGSKDDTFADIITGLIERPVSCERMGENNSE